jgi:acetyl esterase/lipase
MKLHLLAAKALLTLAFAAAPVVAEARAVVSNVVYDASIGTSGVGDLYLPDGCTSNTPVALAIHGGGWSGLDRSSWAGVAEFLCDNLGFAVFNIEYRLAAAGQYWPCCGEDCIDAANYLLSDAFAQQYGIRCKKVWPCGGSAGGHLALWAGLSLPPSQVGGVISISGIGDVLPDSVANPSRYVGLFGHAPTTDELVAASPMSLVTSNSPPVFCSNATTDSVVPPACSQHMIDACLAVGVRAEHYTYDPRDTGHSIWRPGSSPHRLYADIESAIAQFVWSFQGTNLVVGQDDFYQEVRATNDVLFVRPLLNNAIRKTGSGAVTFQNPRVTRDGIDVLEGCLTVSFSDTFAPPALSGALRQKIAFWVDANTNVVADGDGRVSRWHDVRETSVNGPWQYMVATNGETARQPLLASDSSLGGKRYLDFGKWGAQDTNTNSMWLFWANTNGVSRTLDLRAAFIVFGSHNGNGGGGGITLLQNSASLSPAPTAPFAGAGDRLWLNNPNVVADDGVNYLDRQLRDGRYLPVSGQAYHLVEVLTLQTAKANDFAKDRNFPGYSGGARICEAILLTAEPTDAERLQIEDYLWRKWIGSETPALGAIRLGNSAALDLLIGTNRVETTVSGKGTVTKSGAGALVLQNLGSGAFDGTVRLREGGVYAIGEPFRFDLNEGGQSLSVENVKVDRTNGGSAGTVAKTGSGELSVASVAPGVSNIVVSSGSLRLAPPRIAEAAGVASGTVSEPSLEAFTNGVGTSTSFVNFTPQAGPLSFTTNGWTFDRSAYTASGNFLVGVAFDYTSDVIAKGSAPNGHAVLYLNCGLAQATFTAPSAGLYRLSFQAAARSGATVNRYADILVDGTVLRTMVTPSAAYWKYVIRLPYLSSGAHTLGFKAYGADFNRVTVVDDIRVDVEQALAAAPVTAALTNGSFELPAAMIEAGAIVTNQPAGTGWSFEGDSGIGRVQSLDNAPRSTPVAVPEGVAVAVVNSNACIRQTVAFPTSGVYRLSFAAATRLGFAGHAFNVLLASSVVSSLTNSDVGFRRVEVMLPAVTNAAGASAELAFQGQGGLAGTLLDDVRIERVGGLGQPDAVANGGFEMGDAGWTLTQRAGAVQSATSAGWMEVAPYGNYLGYMITNNVLKQSVTFSEAGNYAVRFVTKSRGTSIEPLPYYHGFDVFFNGICAGSVFNANGNTVRTYEFALPAVAVGEAHELEFRGRYASPSTVSFLDEIAVVPQTAVAYESLTNRFPEHLVLEVAQGAGLVLDYQGTVKVETVKYGGHTVSGIIGATTHPEFVSGTGSLFAASKGMLIRLQ